MALIIRSQTDMPSHRRRNYVIVCQQLGMNSKSGNANTTEQSKCYLINCRVLKYL